MEAAKSFTSFEDIFKPNTMNIQATLQKHFTNLLIRANELGLSQNEIQNVFNNSFNSVFNKFIVKEEFATLDIEDQHQKVNNEDEIFSVEPLPLEQTDDSIETTGDSNNKEVKNEEIVQMEIIFEEIE